MALNAKVKKLPTPYGYGAKGHGRDDADAVQRWLDAIEGAAGYLPGRFVCEHPVYYGSEFTVYSPGNDVGVLATRASLVDGALADNQALLLNKTTVNPGADRVDRNARFYNVGLEGDVRADPNSETSHDFVDAIGVDGFELRGCALRDRSRDGVVISNCINHRIIGNEFTRMGDRRAYTTVGAGTWAGGMSIFGAPYPSYQGVIADNYIHGCPGGGGIWLWPSNTYAAEPRYAAHNLCVNNVLEDLCDLGIACGDDVIVARNKVRRISIGDQSGNGIEAHGERSIIALNDISECAVSCINALNMHSGIIELNKLDRAPNLLIVTAVGAWSGMGDVAPRRLLINANIFRNSDGQALRALLFGNLTDGVNVMDGVIVSDNDMGAPTQWKSGRSIDYFPARSSVAGKGFMVPA